ncbi:MAG: ABC transporter permease [Bacteroidaceae bacterium]|nr:ABC transporter permease [Bacteroidaceae bacterium]
MGLIWKLLRQHISVLQLAGFFVANLMGMLIVLLAMQFYQDLGPVFTSKDSFIHDDYLIASKRISTMGGLTGGETSSFTSGEIEDLGKCSFVNSVAGFVASQYKVACYIGIDNVEQFGTEMFFEAVPDEFVDTDRSEWKWSEGQEEVPIILPRTYLAIYNFGFAQSHSLPKMNEGVVSQIGMTVVLRGHGLEQRMKGRVIGFSSRLNTILVPMEFMHWSNGRFAPDADTCPTRVIMSVANPTDSAITTYMKQHGYEIEEDKLDASRMTYFLKIVSAVIMSVGLLISILSFYILMLSIYLLVQKNTVKLQNLLLLGYTTARVSLPYQLLTVFMNIAVLLIALGILFALRGWYMRMLWAMFPDMQEGKVLPTLILGGVLFGIVSLMNIFAVRNKINNIQH